MAALCLCFFVSISLNLNVTALLPTFCKNRFPKISSVWVGVVLSSYSLAYVIAAPLVGLLLPRIGRKNAVIIGVVSTVAAAVLFGLAGYCNNFWFYMTISLIARLIQGVGDAFVNVTIPSIIVIEFPLNCAFYLGLSTTAESVGSSLGPIIASLVYRFLDYP